ncbi:MAG TPA: methyltransferase domain-containing protein [Candidatus Limnocylindrales bacterium]|nr:methyltransferase domain-containing protein [Candidatus Limnocylindrales bacterium]
MPTPLAAREFVDRHGLAHPLDPTLRDRLKPSWRTMLDPIAIARPPSEETLRDRARKAATVVAEASTLVGAATGRPLAGRILEVGCYDGAAAYQLASRPGTEVVASDLARYYLVQRPGSSTDADLGPQQALLDDIRERAGVVSGAAPGTVTFVEDDITSSTLPAGSFDAIVSFEVLEHVADPDAAFAGMARLLRPGGLLYHDYNPFFSINGGHSPCTLDFAWGHARLDAEDFERYLRELRPSEIEQALRFYGQNLNRMTLADLREAVTGAGLELIAVNPWSDRALVPRLESEVLGEVRRSYPTATIEDLLSTFVSIVARRPGGSDGPTPSRP